MHALVRRFVSDDFGSATIEYGLIAVGLSAAIITMVQGIGIRLTANLTQTQTSLR